MPFYVRSKFQSQGTAPPADEPSSGPGPSAAGGAFSGLGGLGASGMPDISQLLGNPTLMTMATQLMQDPNMQNLMSNIMSGTLNAGAQANTPQPPTSGGPAGQGQNSNTSGGAGTEFNLDSLLRV